MAALLGTPGALAQAPSVLPREEPRTEIVITAAREADAVLAARVERALEQDPYLYIGHITVTAENGVVRLTGIAMDPMDMFQAVRLARRIAGKRRVINEIELVSGSADHD